MKKKRYKKNIKRSKRIQRQAVKNTEEKSKDKSVVRMIRFTRLHGLHLESGKLIFGYCYFHLISSPVIRIFKSFPIPVQNVFPCLIVMADIQP